MVKLFSGGSISEGPPVVQVDPPPPRRILLGAWPLPGSNCRRRDRNSCRTGRAWRGRIRILRTSPTFLSTLLLRHRILQKFPHERAAPDDKEPLPSTPEDSVTSGELRTRGPDVADPPGFLDESASSCEDSYIGEGDTSGRGSTEEAAGASLSRPMTPNTSASDVDTITANGSGGMGYRSSDTGDTTARDSFTAVGESSEGPLNHRWRVLTMPCCR